MRARILTKKLPPLDDKMANREAEPWRNVSSGTITSSFIFSDFLRNAAAIFLIQGRLSSIEWDKLSLQYTV